MRKWLCLLVMCGMWVPASAALNVKLTLDRGSFLLYEPIFAKVELHNNTEQELILGDPEAGSAWLTFLVTDTARAGSAVRPDVPSQFPSVTMRPGEKRTLAVNITPLYAIRDAGEYKISAVVDLPGQSQIATGGTVFSIFNGQKLWSQVRPVDASERTYTLLRFSPSGVGTYLYLRVEDVKENLVYVTAPVGELADAINPEVIFDPDGQINILHIASQGMWHFARFSADGQLNAQNDFTSTQDAPPRLIALPTGGVVVRGGVAKAADERPREKLTDAMAGRAPATAAPVGAAPPVAAPPRETLTPPKGPPKAAPVGGR